MKGISVIVCCYNSAQRLPATLKHLAEQKVNDNFLWEIIIVNNNSTDDTCIVAEETWKNLGSPCPLRVVDEPKPGLSFAREKGIAESNYDLLLWCDDDNWLNDQYIRIATSIMENDLEIGALGGWCEAAFESKEPEWFGTYAKYFAVSKQGKISGDITRKKGCVYGAGMVLRKSNHVRLKAFGFKNILKDREGKNLSSGGDTEYCYALRLIGKKIWYDERLYFKHFMTDGRMSLSYVSRIRKAMSHSNFMLWPYLDILHGRRQGKKDFIVAALKGVPILPIKKFGALVLGDFEQKETAKKYFRLLKYRFFKYNTYRINLEIIDSWKPKN